MISQLVFIASVLIAQVISLPPVPPEAFYLPEQVEKPADSLPPRSTSAPAVLAAEKPFIYSTVTAAYFDHYNVTYGLISSKPGWVMHPNNPGEDQSREYPSEAIRFPAKENGQTVRLHVGIQKCADHAVKSNGGTTYRSFNVVLKNDKFVCTIWYGDNTDGRYLGVRDPWAEQSVLYSFRDYRDEKPCCNIL